MFSLFETQQLKSLHPAVYVGSWIALSSMTILFNKYIMSNLEFRFPAVLTCWHLLFATIATQLLARTTTVLDSRHTVRMTGRVYLRAIVPIGIFYSASLVCSNQVYLYLSVAFIQMLKASAPMAVLITSFLFGVANPTLKVIANVTIIVFGVALASFGEIKFLWIGFFYQMGGIVFEAIRLVMIQILLSGEGQKMDPMVSLYYYAPVCALMNFLVAAATELRSFQMADIWRVGPFVLVANAAVAFLLNVASVLLIGKTSGLVMTLCGVLKNILIVVASVLIWGTIITRLQFLGYGIATVGLIYYGVGYDGMVAYYTSARDFAAKMWEGDPDATITTERPTIFKKALVASMCVLIATMLAMGMWMRSGPYDEQSVAVS